MCLWIPFKLLFSAALIDGNLGVDQQTCLFSIETQVEPATGWRLRWLTCFAVSSFWASWLFLINLNRKARACFMCWNHGPMVSLLISSLSSARGSLESQMNHWELLVEFGRHSPETPFILWLTIWLCLKIGAHHNPSKSHIHDFLMSFYRIGERVQRYMTSSPLLRVVFFWAKPGLWWRQWWQDNSRLKIDDALSGFLKDFGWCPKIRATTRAKLASSGGPDPEAVQNSDSRKVKLQLAVGHGSTWKAPLQHLPFDLDHSSRLKHINVYYINILCFMFGKFGIIHPQSDPIVDTFARHGADGIANSPSQTSNCDTNSSKMIFLGLSDDLASVKTLKKQTVNQWKAGADKTHMRTAQSFQTRGLKSILFGNMTRNKQVSKQLIIEL